MSYLRRLKKNYEIFSLTYKFYGRSYIAYTDDIKYVIYAFFSTDTINTSTPIILDFVKVKFRDYKFFFPISAVKKKFTKYFR